HCSRPPLRVGLNDSIYAAWGITYREFVIDGFDAVPGTEAPHSNSRDHPGVSPISSLFRRFATDTVKLSDARFGIFRHRSFAKQESVTENAGILLVQNSKSLIGDRLWDVG
ncbi:MAG: hypothetical protein KDA81_11465, partial [Planctomycetaceae bacterium]|nr:hypothetical protein [Planctomycetaceae bacterium]